MKSKTLTNTVAIRGGENIHISSNRLDGETKTNQLLRHALAIHALLEIPDDLTKMMAERDALAFALERLGALNTQIRYALKEDRRAEQAAKEVAVYPPAMIDALVKCAHALGDAREFGLRAASDLMQRAPELHTAPERNAYDATQAWGKARADCCCGACNGTGAMNADMDPCNACDGTGWKPTPEDVDVTPPNPGNEPHPE